MVAVADRVEAEHGGVARRGEHGAGEEPLQHRAAARGERGRVVHDFVVVQDGERGVQVVVRGVGQLQADDRTAEELLRLGVPVAGAAEAVAGQDVPPGDEEVALALVDVRRVVHLEAPVTNQSR
ncbi:hypothetical protein SRIMM317S_04732 [Streptomyces rimosus subsp. rimosus]